MNHEDSMIAQKHCIPCEAGTTPLSPEEITRLVKETPTWSVLNNKALVRDFELKNFRETLKFINRVGDVAETEGHHPDIYLHDYKHVKLTLSTHAIGGLSENDFILAAKIDRL